MAAHLRQITFSCIWPACVRTATHEVHNTRNAPMGRYCKPHAKQELARFLRVYPEER